MSFLAPRYLEQHLLALLEFATFEERPGEIQQDLSVLILVEFLQAVLILWSRTVLSRTQIIKTTVLLGKHKGGPHHLHGADVLLLLHVDVSQIQPDVADVSRGLPHLCKHIPSFSEVALVGQDGTWT